MSEMIEKVIAFRIADLLAGVLVTVVILLLGAIIERLRR